MSTFAFRALDAAGTTARGEIEGDSMQAVAAQLRGRGLTVVELKETAVSGGRDVVGRFKKVKSRDLTIATRQLATMVASGMSLLTALYVLEQQTATEGLREKFAVVRADV